jgi:hypothetical protein
VQEYIVWRIEDEAIDWFLLRDEQYEPLLADSEGILRSEVFPGLWLDPVALLKEEYQRVLEVVQQGIASAEHEAFVRELQGRRAT